MQEVSFKLPNCEMRSQMMKYEYETIFCSSCHKIDHRSEKCHVNKQRPKNARGRSKSRARGKSKVVVRDKGKQVVGELYAAPMLSITMVLFTHCPPELRSSDNTESSAVVMQTYCFSHMQNAANDECSAEAVSTDCLPALISRP